MSMIGYGRAHQLVAGVAAAGCAAHSVTSEPAPQSPAAVARADGGHPAVAQADLHFMSGMIGHHAQAVLIAGWAPGHGASAPIRVLCERIVVSQRDEIAFMQRWLRERGLPLPGSDPAGRAEQLSSQARREVLAALSQQLHTEARSAADQPRAHGLASAIGELAK